MKTLFPIIAAVMAGSLTALAQAATASPASDLDRLVFADQSTPRRVDILDAAITRDLLNDKLAVVSFIGTDCLIVCITRTMEIDRLARTLPADLKRRVVFLAINTDPTTGDPQRLRRFGEDLLGRDAEVHILASDVKATKALLATIGHPASALPEPPAMVMLFDRRGQIAMTYGGDPLDTSRLRQDLGVLDTFTEGLGPSPTGAADTPHAPH
ncbi:SCO family protein [Methylobacterium sp. NFXW15]|uniref:SCO family protein n=1 Tax=Methylobacterium sp. NFXW15 TaxID=2819512 RepID=UPI003CF47B2D